MKQIDVIIDAQGNPSIQTSGFSGDECVKETAALERALGAKTKDVKTPEYYKATRGVIAQ
jgi:hypothetical protein